MDIDTRSHQTPTVDAGSSSDVEDDEYQTPFNTHATRQLNNKATNNPHVSNAAVSGNVFFFSLPRGLAFHSTDMFRKTTRSSSRFKLEQIVVSAHSSKSYSLPELQIEYEAYPTDRGHKSRWI